MNTRKRNSMGALRLSESKLRDIVGEAIRNNVNPTNEKILQEYQDSDFDSPEQRKLRHQMTRGVSPKGVRGEVSSTKADAKWNKKFADTDYQKSHNLHDVISARGARNLQLAHGDNFYKAINSPYGNYKIPEINPKDIASSLEDIFTSVATLYRQIDRNIPGSISDAEDVESRIGSNDTTNMKYAIIKDDLKDIMQILYNDIAENF